jgi:hypothetical protein
LALALAGCAQRQDPIAADAESARERTVPSGGRVVRASPLRRETHSARASWEIETGMAWNAYAAWVQGRLGDYRLVERGPDRLRLTRALAGDVYVLVLVAKPGSRSSTIEVSFEAAAF